MVDQLARLGLEFGRHLLLLLAGELGTAHSINAWLMTLLSPLSFLTS